MGGSAQLRSWSLPASPSAGVIVAPELVVVGRLCSQDDADRVLAAWDRFASRHGDTVRWQDYGKGRWSGASTSMWPRLHKKLSGGGWAKGLCSYTLHGGDNYDSAVARAWELFVHGATGQWSLRWVTDPAAPVAAFMDDVRWLVTHLPITWAYGGLGLFGPGYSDATGGRHDAVGEALMAHPLLGPAHPLLWGTRHLGVCNLGWLTVLGPQYLGKLGGAAAVRKQLGPHGFEHEMLGHNLLLRCGATPSPASPASLQRPALERLWQVVEPVRPSRAQLEDSWIAGLTLDEMKHWVLRWET